MVGVSRRGRVPRWKTAPRFEREYAEPGDGVYNWNGSEQERARPGENPRSAGRGAQQPLVRGILAAHAGRGRSDRGRSRLDFETLGPCAARNHGRGSRRPLDERAWRANDLFGATHQHERKDSRRGTRDSALRHGTVRLKRDKELLLQIGRFFNE